MNDDNWLNCIAIQCPCMHETCSLIWLQLLKDISVIKDNTIIGPDVDNHVWWRLIIIEGHGVLMKRRFMRGPSTALLQYFLYPFVPLMALYIDNTCCHYSEMHTTWLWTVNVFWCLQLMKAARWVLYMYPHTIIVILHAGIICTKV